MLARVAGDALARAVHADGARAGAGDRGGFGESCSASRWPWAPSSPGWSWDGRSSASGGHRGAADARRLRRAVLRLGRHAVRSPAPGSRRRASIAATLCRHPGRQAARRAGDRAAASGIPSGSPSRSPSPSAQIGEFSFILAAAGTALGILDEQRPTRSSPRRSSRSRSTRSTTG